MYKFFKIEEFKCPCCGENRIDKKFVELLDYARIEADTPFVITSGYRCQKHNDKVKGVEESAHTLGLAADIRAETSSQRFLILKSLIDIGFSRIGIAKTFIHVDMAKENKPQNVGWLY